MDNNEINVKASFTKTNKGTTISCHRGENVPPGVDPSAYWTTLYDECKKLVEEKFFAIDTQPTVTTYQFPQRQDQQKQQSAARPEKKEGDKCEYCGAAMVKSFKTGKIFCSAKCWLNK